MFPWRALLAGGLVGMTLLSWGAWMKQRQEETVLEIRAPREPIFALPVYAQFVVTQKFVLPDATPIMALVLPLYVPEPGSTLTITLRQDGAQVEQWRHQLPNSGIQNERLLLSQPRHLIGTFELEVDGQTIPAQLAEQAPRVFVEGDNQAYPNGNYRVANNEKEGDVGLTVVTERTHWQQWLENWRHRPLGQAGAVGYWLVVLVLVGALPYTLTGVTKAGK